MFKMKTKILLLLASICLFNTAAYSQWAIGGKIGINGSNIHYPGPLIDNPKLKSGMNLGATATYYFNNWLSGQIELVYSNRGYKEKDFVLEEASPEESLKDLIVTCHYLDLPLLAKIYPFKCNFNIQVGPQIGFLLSRSIKFDDKKQNQDGIDKQPIDFGLVFGAGYEFTQGFFIDARYLLGLNSIYKTGEGFQNRGLQLSIGYKFLL